MPGHSDIPCVRGSLPGQANQSNIDRFEYTASVEVQVVLMQGWHPDITDDMQCVVDGHTYRISGVDEETQRVVTRLRIERIS